jgi:hypothetical protein
MTWTIAKRIVAARSRGSGSELALVYVRAGVTRPAGKKAHGTIIRSPPFD